MPKIVEEAVVSTHSDMNTTDFLSQYMRCDQNNEQTFPIDATDLLGLSSQKCYTPAVLLTGNNRKSNSTL